MKTKVALSITALLASSVALAEVDNTIKINFANQTSQGISVTVPNYSSTLSGQSNKAVTIAMQGQLAETVAHVTYLHRKHQQPICDVQFTEATMPNIGGVLPQILVTDNGNASSAHCMLIPIPSPYNGLIDITNLDNN